MKDMLSDDNLQLKNNRSYMLRILFVEDKLTDAELIWRELWKNKIVFEKQLVDNQKDYLKGLKNFNPDIIISDYSLPRFNGMKALQLRNQNNPLTPFILVTGSINEEVAVECMKAGADDYILKDNLSRLGPAVNNAINKIELLRKKDISESALRESEERSRILVEKSPDAIALHRDGKFIFINPAGVRLIGANSPEDLLGKSILNIVHPDSRKDVMERLRKEIEGEDAPLFEEKFVKLDGSVIDVEVVGIPFILQGQPTVQVIVRDITRRKQVEKSLRDSEEKYRSIFENVQDVYYESSLNGVILDVSPSIEALSKGQYKPAELVGKSMYDYCSIPDEMKYLLDSLQIQGKLTDHEITFRKRDGSLIPCSLSAKIYYDDLGNPVKILGSIRDITERKKAEEKVQHERILLRTLIDNLPDPIYVLDKNGRKVISNKADVDNIGAGSEEEVLGKTDVELFPGSTGARGHADNLEVINTGRVIFEKEEDFVDREGKRKWLLTTMVPLRNTTGSIEGLVGIGHDITQRKKDEEALISAKEKAEESDRLKTAFLHNISHEIRTPMNAIVGFSALLDQQETDEATRRSYIDVIMQSSNHLLAIISDIVDISNIEANLVKIISGDININSLLGSLYNQFSQVAEKKKIRLSFTSELPDNDAFITTDSTKLTQVISNILNNAIKFTDIGEVHLLLQVQEKFLYFSISDTGIGIPEEYQSRVFERFYQVQGSTSRIYEGTGLGLAISKAYVELLGGRIWLTSQSGKGTTFCFTIPYIRQAKTVTPVPVKNHIAEFAFKEKKKILIAEDIDSNFKLLTYFLAGTNTEIIRALNGREAVEKFQEVKDIDLVLMDVKMPVMDGYTAVKLIRETNKKTPIIAQTAYADDKDKAIHAGCNGFISKPFDKKRLVTVLSEYL